MNRWVEERVEAIRLALKIVGFPAEADLYRLVDWLEGCIVLRHSPVGIGMCIHRDDGRAVITLPQGVERRELDHILCEEVGHYLLTCGMASLLRQLDPADPQVRRLARVWDWRDEALVREFVHAWYLPSRLVQQFPDDEELAFRSGCSLEVVVRRRAALAGEAVRLIGPPRWSAAREYRLKRQRIGAQPYLQILPRGEARPEFLVPLPDADAREMLLQATADLIALTNREHALKYAPFRCTADEAVNVSLSELEAWSGKGA